MTPNPLGEMLWSLGGTLLGAFFVLLYVAYLMLKTINQEKLLTKLFLEAEKERKEDRDIWRIFKYAPKRRIIKRAGNRCEWFSKNGQRCEETKNLEVDHIYPWSSGGWTLESNAQVLCHAHHILKGGVAPTDEEIAFIEKKRKQYFPKGENTSLRWRPTDEERALRTPKK